MIFQSHTKLLEQVNEKAFELEVPRVENYVLRQVTSYDDFHSGSSRACTPLAASLRVGLLGPGCHFGLVAAIERVFGV